MNVLTYLRTYATAFPRRIQKKVRLFVRPFAPRGWLRSDISFSMQKQFFDEIFGAKNQHQTKFIRFGGAIDI